MLSRADVLALPLSHRAQQSQEELGAIGIISQERVSVWPTPYLSRRSRLSTSPCYASYPPSCPTLPPAYKYAADATMQGTGHTLVHLARTAAAPPIAPSPEIAAPQMHAGLVGNFTIAMNAPSKPNGKPTSNASFALMNAIGRRHAHATTRLSRTQSRVQTIASGACAVPQKAIPPLGVTRMEHPSTSPRRMRTGTGACGAALAAITCKIACDVCRALVRTMRNGSWLSPTIRSDCKGA